MMGGATTRPGPARAVSHPAELLDATMHVNMSSLPNCSIMLDKATILRQLRLWSTCDVRTPIIIEKFNVG